MTSDIGLVPLMRSRAVAEVLGVSMWQVDELRRQGVLRSIAVGCRSHRYHPDDVRDFILRRRG